MKAECDEEISVCRADPFMLDVYGRVISCGKTVIITSHDLSEIEKCADDVSMIKNGRLLFDKGIQEMQGQSLEEIFIKEGNRHE